ncbi:hypothetical protein B0T18DRAFT_386386 [Schizothecium vesticola]|uniref:Uncharacterized protein n=1 Tax=Schizothecium vesticola TaxID=314040 RepID=A0AA40FBB7_9PEZI|nr:hypothetical protein B0T18DRAFT_386386 [Schizothecium vesticola]
MTSSRPRLDFGTLPPLGPQRRLISRILNQSWLSTSRQGRRSPNHLPRLPWFRRPTFPGQTRVPASDDEAARQSPAWIGGTIPHTGTSMASMRLAPLRIHHWAKCDGPVISSGRLAQGYVSTSNNRFWMDQSIASGDDEDCPQPSHYSGKPCLWIPISRRMSPKPRPTASITLSELFSTRPNLETVDCSQQTREQMRVGIETITIEAVPGSSLREKAGNYPSARLETGQVVARGYSKLDDFQFGRLATFRSIPSRLADDKTQHSPMGSFDFDKREIALYRY